MRVIENILFYGGIILAFTGIWSMTDSLLLGIKLMPVGLVLMYIGWLLSEYKVSYDDL